MHEGGKIMDAAVGWRGNCMLEMKDGEQHRWPNLACEKCLIVTQVFWLAG
jgi:hypothetical protein